MNAIAKSALKQKLKKFFKLNNQLFIEKVVDIYYEGSLRNVLAPDEPENVDPTVESKVIAHFCTGSVITQFSDIITNQLLTEWLLFKKCLMQDKEAAVMYNVLINCYTSIYKID